MKRAHPSVNSAWIFALAAGVLPMAACQAAGERPPQSPSVRGEGNRIEVTSNRASNVRVACNRDGQAPAANVNSVQVDGRALKGETVIVTGRNTRDVVVQDCTAETGATGGGRVNVNSVNIR